MLMQTVIAEPTPLVTTKPTFGSPEWWLWIIAFIVIVAILVAILARGVGQKGKREPPTPRRR